MAEREHACIIMQKQQSSCHLKEIAADFMLLHVKEKREKDFCVLEPVSNFVEEKCNGKKPTGAIE